MYRVKGDFAIGTPLAARVKPRVVARGNHHLADAYVYILSNDRKTVLYTGCTQDLRQRIGQHLRRLVPGFTKKYNVHRLVYFEALTDLAAARLRERQIKGMLRAKKEALISLENPSWQELMPAAPGP